MTLYKWTQQPGSVPGPVARNKIMRLVCNIVQPHYGFALHGIRFTAQEECGDRPDRIKLGLTIYHMFELGRNFQMRDDVPQGLGREVLYGHDIAGIYLFHIGSELLHVLAVYACGGVAGAEIVNAEVNAMVYTHVFGGVRL